MDLTPRSLTSSSIVCFVDGLCEAIHEGELGNPRGIATFGFIIYHNGSLITGQLGHIGTGEGMDSVVAEYEALIHALRYLFEHNLIGEDVEVRNDNQQLYLEMTGATRPQEVAERPHFDRYKKAKELASHFADVQYTLIKGRTNEADFLSKKAYKLVRASLNRRHI